MITKLRLASLLAIVLCGCHSIQLPVGPTGAVAKFKSFGQKVTIGEASYSTNGTLMLKGYNLDQVSGINAMSTLINGAIIAGGQAAGKAVVP